MKKHLIVILLLLSITFINGQTSEQPTGSGTEANPYHISSVENLLWVSENSSEWGSGKYYVQTDSLDLFSLSDFSPIGNASTSFDGKYDGQENPILNLTVFDVSGSDLGLFGVTGTSAEIENVSLQYFDVLGKDRIGGLVGTNNGSITNSTGRGLVSVLNISGDIAGGLVGKNSGTITRCNVMIHITGSNKVGGLVGENLGGIVKESYSEGKVKGRELVGGLIGNNGRIDDTQIGTTTNCYSRTDVMRTEGSIGEKIGGFIGGNDSKIEYSYSTGKVMYESTSTPEPGEKVWPKRSRGISMGKMDDNMIKEDVFKRMADLGVNVVTVNFYHDDMLKISDTLVNLPAVPDSFIAYTKALFILDKIVENVAKNNMFLVIDVSRALGVDELDVATGETEAENEEDEKYFVKKLTEVLVFIAEKYKDNPTVICYGFITEPHTTWIVTNWRDKVVPDIIAAVRAVDNNTYLNISAGLWAFPGQFAGMQPYNDPADKIIYSIHDYSPHNYTHQGIGGRQNGLLYPGMLKMFNDSPLKYWDREELQNHMQPAIDFMQKFNVKMYVGEFGVARWALGADKWMDDKISLFEEFGISYGVFCFGGENWDGWNLTVGDDAEWGQVADGGVETNRLKVVKKYLRKNTEFND